MSRKIKNMLRISLVYFGIAVSAICLISVLLYTLINGLPHITLDFLLNPNAPRGETLIPMIITTLIMVALTLLISVPIGIGSAIYLTEYASKDSKFVKLIKIAIETLAGIPSIIYGIFGFLFYVVILGWSWSILAGVGTLSIMVLPTIIGATEEALKSVPKFYREGSFALGAGKFYTIRKVVLPSAITGILAAVLLSIGRIIGESAALMLTAGTIIAIPMGLFSSASTLSVFMYTITIEGSDINRAFATAVVLMFIVLLLNLFTNYIANKLKTF